MKQKRILTVIVTAFMALALVIGGGLTTAYARDGQSGGDEPEDQTVHVEDENDNSGPASKHVEDKVKDSQDNEDESTHEVEPAEMETEREHVKQELEAAREKVHAVREKLQGEKLHACEARQSAIRTIMQNAGERGDNHIAVFSKITERVEAFYVSKGKTLSNYDQLVAEVAAKKAAAQAAVDAVKSADTQFTCDGDNPKGMISVFKAELKAQVTAMKEYRAAVKNLIAGVKSVQTDDTSKTEGQ